MCSKPVYCNVPSYGMITLTRVGDEHTLQFEKKSMQEVARMRSAILTVSHNVKTGVRSVSVAPYDHWCVIVDGWVMRMSNHSKGFAIAMAYEGVVYRPFMTGYKVNAPVAYPLLPFLDYKPIAIMKNKYCITRRILNGGVGEKVQWVKWLTGMLEYSPSFAKIDKEYCDGEVNMTVDKSKLQKPICNRDEVVQRRFEGIYDIKLNGRDGMSGRPTMRMRGVDWRQRCSIYDAWVEGKHLSWIDIKGDFRYGVKPASIKKDGSRRLVFPMAPKINAYLTQTFGKQSPKYPSNVKIVKNYNDFDSCCRYSYDVKSCDKVAFPYLVEAVRKIKPNAVEKIFGKCVYDGREYDLPQIPSGMSIFMEHYASVFACAIANLAEHPGTINVQGDGIITEIPLEGDVLKLLHREDDYIINGFDVRNHTYVRADDKLSTPILKIPGKLYGIKKWCFRRVIYEKLLKATVTLPHRDRDLYDHYNSLTIQELNDIAFQGDEETYGLIARCSARDYDIGRSCGYDESTQGFLK